MRVVVVGASGRTGKLIVQLLKKAGHEVVGTIRNPKHMAEFVKAGVEPAMIDLDTSDMGTIEHAFAGADAVIFAAGSAEGESSAIDKKGVQRTLRAAGNAHVRRYIAISSYGASTPLPEGWADTPEMKEYFAAKKSANRMVQKSSLFWTIVEPGELGEGKGAGKVAISTDGSVTHEKVARADVAALIVKLLDNETSVGQTIQVVGGTTPIATALKKL